MTADEGFGDFAVGTVKNTAEGWLRNFHGRGGLFMIMPINIVEFDGFDLVWQESDFL